MATKSEIRKSKQFIDVEFRAFFPSNEVADNEIFLAFTNDDDALKFQIWWFEFGGGSESFKDWLDDRQK